jgi:hypothetical protein
MVVDWPARLSAYRARIRRLTVERNLARQELVTARQELAGVGPVLLAVADALPRHEPRCLCELCTVRRQVIAAADSYAESS